MVVPMTSARMGDGRYEVIGTSTACEVIRRATSTNAPFWALYSNGAYVRSFTTKRAALTYCQETPAL